jgi:hypothetical protein
MAIGLRGLKVTAEAAEAHGAAKVLIAALHSEGVTATGIANTLTDRGSRNPYSGDSSSDGMVRSFLPRTKPAALPAAFATASRPR